jgi:glycosyltransferase involved in cell wall biosynthesis
MIVKNEERNIERALTWAKSVAFEQIVVDTGSTDHTVEIAESMGAKVFHFEWINDFAAAKNYAIDKACGNWIAFLDADEYFTEEHTKRLKEILDEIQSKQALNSISVLQCDILQLNDDGAAFIVNEQRRVFRKSPGIRYVGRIHEYLSIEPKYIVTRVDDIEILHAGYTREAYSGTGKAERNIGILREELESRPDDATLKGYLADSLLVSGDAANIAESVRLHREIVDDVRAIVPMTLKSAYDHLIQIAISAQDADGILSLCARATEKLPNCPDYPFYAGKMLHVKGRYAESLEEYEKCEKAISETKSMQNRMSLDNLVGMYQDMARSAFEMGKYDACMNYAVRALTCDKYHRDTLVMFMLLLNALVKSSTIDERTRIERLSNFYDFDDPRDKLFLAKCAKEANDTVLMLFFFRQLTAADKAELVAQQGEPA